MYEVARRVPEVLSPLPSAEDYCANALQKHEIDPERILKITEGLLDLTTPPTTCRSLRAASAGSASSIELSPSGIPRDLELKVNALALALKRDAESRLPGSPHAPVDTARIEEDELLLLDAVREARHARRLSGPIPLASDVDSSTVTASAAPSSAPTVALAAPEKVAIHGSLSAFPKTRVFLVDDEDLNNKLMRRMLAELSDLTYDDLLLAPADAHGNRGALSAMNGNEAIATLAKPYNELCTIGDKIGIAFIDDQMPELKGSEAISELRARWPHIVFILATGNKELLDTYKELGFDGFLNKPFNKSAITDVIENIWTNFSSNPSLAKTRLWTKPAAT